MLLKRRAHGIYQIYGAESFNPMSVFTLPPWNKSRSHISRSELIFMFDFSSFIFFPLIKFWTANDIRSWDSVVPSFQPTYCNSKQTWCRTSTGALQQSNFTLYFYPLCLKGLLCECKSSPGVHKSLRLRLTVYTDHYFIQMVLLACLVSVTLPFSHWHLFFSVNCLFLLSTQREASESREYLTHADSAEQTEL